MENKDNLRKRKVKVEVKGKLIEYDEYYLVDSNGEEIFDRNIEIKNDERLYELYKKQSNLLTKSEIKNIRKKYNLTQKEYALAIGVGEVTVHRFEKGAIQTEAVDSIMRLSTEPNNMYFLIIQNKKNLNKETYKKLLDRVNELIILKKHALIDINENEFKRFDFKSTQASNIAHNIINSYNDKASSLARKYGIKPEFITNLKIQKLLYYVQAYSLLIFNKPAFKEKILAWSYGPVVYEVYQEYKNNHANEIETRYDLEEVSDGLQKIIDMVIENYGSVEANELIRFTHEEDPWRNSKLNSEIDINSIKEYFNRIYNI